MFPNYIVNEQVENLHPVNQHLDFCFLQNLHSYLVWENENI